MAWLRLLLTTLVRELVLSAALRKGLSILQHLQMARGTVDRNGFIVGRRMLDGLWRVVLKENILNGFLNLVMQRDF